MNIVPSGEQTQPAASRTQSVEPFAQHGLQSVGAQPHLNPNAQTFKPGVTHRSVGLGPQAFALRSK